MMASSLNRGIFSGILAGYSLLVSCHQKLGAIDRILMVYNPTKSDLDRILMSEIAAYNLSKEL